MTFSLISRRAALGAGLLAATVGPSTLRAQTGDAPASAVSAFSNTLLAAMRAGRATPFAQRYAMLAPVVDRTFDLETILRNSVGFEWPGMPPQQQDQLRAAFRRYTIANFAANFDSYAGQSIQVNPEPRSLPNGDQIISTDIIKSGGDRTNLSYVMHREPSGWKVVDVLADGSISRVATQRSDFRSLLSSGGAPALVASLQDKTAVLSGNAPV